eukprot:4224462-Pyramimonas_sp.AAC.2
MLGGHKILVKAVSATGVPVLFCHACGDIASCRAARLMDTVCHPALNAELRKLRRGLLPGVSGK